jgi:transcriptional regulator with XRE-family HTH domain
MCLETDYQLKLLNLKEQETAEIDEYPTFSTLLTRVRSEKRFSQQFLAERIGVTKQFVCKLEKGQDLPSTEKLELICSALEVSPNYFDESIKQSRKERGK